MVSKSPVHVAYAEDHDIIRQGVRDLLTAMGCCVFVIEASNGEELIEKLEKAKAPPDVCMLDIYMPKMDGHQTLREIKKRWPEMKVLILTGHHSEYQRIKMIRSDANGYLLKNAAPREVEKAIISIHETGSYYPDLASSKFARKVKENKIQLPELTDKEATLLRHCCSDLSYPQIAEKMGISPKSVEYIREGLFRKLAVGNRSGMVVFAIQSGLVEISNNTVDKE